MGCEENKIKLSYLVDGQLEPEEARSLLNHISSCRECSQYFKDLQDAKKALKQAPRLAASPSFVRRLEARLRREGTGAYMVPVMSRNWVRKAISAGIAAAVLVAVVLILSKSGVKETAPSDEPEITAADPGREKITAAPPTTLMTREQFEEEKKHRLAQLFPIKQEHKEPAVERDIHETPEPPPFVDEGKQEEPKIVDEEAPQKPDVEEKPELPEVPPAPGGEGTEAVEGPKDEKPLKQPVEVAATDLRTLERDFFSAAKARNVDGQMDALHKMASLPIDKSLNFFKRILIGERKQVETSVRREALFALAENGSKQAAGVMLYIYDDAAEEGEIREAVPDALAQIERQETLDWLVGEVLSSQKRQANVRKMVAEVLALVDKPVSYKPLAAALLKEPDEKVRVAICTALGATKDTSAEEVLLKALKDRQWVVREAALRALGKTGTISCVPPLIRLLNDAQPLVQEAAATALSENPDVRAVEPLIKLYKSHKTQTDLRLRGAVLTALWRITGERYVKGSDWSSWFKKMGPYPETNPDPGAIPGAPAAFIDIPLWTNSVVYLVDASGSMRSDGKLDEAKNLIKQSIISLPKDTKFNIFFFSSNIRGFSQTSFPRADTLNKAKALQWLDRILLPQEKKTNFYHALTTVLRSKPDDLVVISDGVPTEGRYVYPPKLVRVIADQNLQGKTRIHAVGFYTVQLTEGTGNPVPVGPSVDFLRDLSKRNYGEFRHRLFFKSGSGK